MATVGGIRAGRAFVEIFADNGPLQKGLRQAEGYLKQWGNTVRNAGIQMAAAGGAIMLPLYKGITAFGDFEKQMKYVSTMLEGSEMDWMDKFSKGVEQLSKDVGESTATISKGLYDILSASIDPADAMDVLSVSVKAAKGGMTDTAIAVEGLTRVLNSYGLAASEATRVSDLMFATVDKGGITYPELAAEIGTIAPMARAAGMSLENLSAALATISRQAPAEETFTYLRNVLAQAPAEAGKDILALAKKYKGADLETIQKDFPERRASLGIAALAGDIEGLTEDILYMNTAAGKAEAAYQKMTGGVSNSLDRAKASTDALWRAIGAALAPAIVDAIGWFRLAAQSVSDWISQNKGAVVLALKFATALIGVGAAAIAFGMGLRIIAIPLGLLRSGFGLLATGLILVAGPFKILISLFKSWPMIVAVITKPITALMAVLYSLAILVTPAGALIAGITAIGATFLITSGVLTRSIKDLGALFGQLKSQATEAFAAISKELASGNIEGAMNILGASLKLGFQTLVMGLKKAWIDFCGSVKQFGSDAFNGLLLVVNEVITAIDDIWTTLIRDLSSAWNGFFDKIKTTANWIKSHAAWFGGVGTGLLFGSDDAGLQKEQAAIEAAAKAREEANAKEREAVKQNHDMRIRQILEESRTRGEAIDKEKAEAIAADEEVYAKLMAERDALISGADKHPGPEAEMVGTGIPESKRPASITAAEPKENELAKKSWEDIQKAQTTFKLQGGGVNVNEAARQAYLQQYTQMSQGPGFDEQSEEAVRLRTSIESLQTPMQSFIGQLQAIPPLWQQIGNLMFQTVQTFTEGIGNAVAQVLVYGESFGKMMTQLGKQIAAQIISALVSMGVQWLITSAMSLLGIGMTLTAAMKSYAAQTYAAAFAATAAIPFIGPEIAPGVAAGAVATMLAGAAASGAAGAGVGMGIAAAAEGGIFMHPGLTRIAERGRPEIVLNRGNISRFFPEIAGGGGIYEIHVHNDMDGREMSRNVLRWAPSVLREHGAV